ncbi:MAG: hypothetical protein AAF694_22580 [Bacteroidota bacterium]
MKKSYSIYFSFLLVLILVGGFLLFRSCNQEKVEMPWGAWELLSQRLRAHPNHLPAQWQQALEQNDPVLLFEFVRDRIQTIPPYVRPIGNQQFRWNIPGVLRTGQGTSLEKAMLLREGLEALGLSTKFYYGRWNSTQWQSLYQAIHPPAIPIEGLESIRKLHKKYGIAAWSQSEVSFPEAEIQAFDKKVHDFLVEIHKPKEPNWENLARTLYLVGVEVDSQEVFLNPSFKDAKWGESYTQNKPLAYRLGARHPASEITIRLKASYDDRSYSPFTLAEAHWPLEKVMGKDIQVGFRVLGPPEVLLSNPVEEFESFVSTIELLNTMDSPLDSCCISGDVITTRGKVIPKERAVSLLEEELFLSTGDASQVKSVAVNSLKIADFPTLLVETDVRDDQGEAVMDLSEEDFNFLIDGEKVTHRMIVNQRTPPRVLFLYDDSGSMPKEYTTREKTVDLFQQIAEACHQVNPETEFALSPFGDEKTKIHKLSDWSNQVGVLLEYIQNTSSGRSNNWSALFGATNIPEANMVILLTDSDGTERSTSYTDQRFKEGLPGLIYGIQDSYTKEEEFQKMADKTGGVHFWIEKEFPKAMADLQARIAETKNERYLVEVEVENQEIPLFDLEVQVGKDGPFAEFKGIENPRSSFSRPGGKNAITGLYVEVSYLNETFTHKIAGVPLGSSPRRYPVTQDLIDACNNALWGEYILHIEGSTPISELVLEDKCQHYLALKALMALMEEPDPATFFQQLQGIRWRPDFPGKIPLLLNGGDSLFENSLSLWMYSKYPDKEGKYWETLEALGFQERYEASIQKEVTLTKQLGVGITQAYVIQQNYGNNPGGFLTMHPLASYRISSNGYISNPKLFQGIPKAQNMLEALTENSLNNSTILVTQDSMNADMSFLVKRNSYNLTPIGGKGYVGGRSLPMRLAKSKALIDQAFLWTKTLGMRMDTWMDLEGDKLAFIQAGNAGVNGLGNNRTSQELMEEVKEKIKVYVLAEMDQPAVYFSKISSSQQEAFTLSRNNLSALFNPLSQ